MRALALCLAVLAGPALSQDRQGNDTPGDWRVTHHSIFGIWNSMCDMREEAGTPVRRCYLRRVDVFSPRPEFAAQFLFVTPEREGYRVSFGIEPGTFFALDGFRIEGTEGTDWQTRRPGCLSGLSCNFTGPAAEALLEAMREGGAFRFTFRDRHGQPQDLTWPLDDFAAAWADFQGQAARRGLLP